MVCWQLKAPARKLSLIHGSFWNGNLSKMVQNMYAMFRRNSTLFYRIKAVSKGEETSDTCISEGFSRGQGYSNLPTVQEKKNADLFGENTFCRSHTRQHGEICLGKKRYTYRCIHVPPILVFAFAELIFTVHSLHYCMHLRLTFLLFDLLMTTQQWSSWLCGTGTNVTDTDAEDYNRWSLGIMAYTLLNQRMEPKVMEVWKMIFLFNLVIFRWSMLIFRGSFRIPILSLAFVVQPFEPWDQGQSLVSPWLPCGSYVAGQTEGLCTRCFGERRGSCPKPERSLPDGFFLWKTDPTKKSNLKTSTSENKLGSLFSQWIGGFQALILGRVTYP